MLKSKNEIVARNGLDPVLNTRIRLSIVSTLIQVKRTDFSHLKEITVATQGNLSHQIKKLQEEGYIDIIKVYKGNYPQTICKITLKGKKAFENYVKTIKRMLDL